MYIQYKNIKYPLSNLSTRKETINDNIGYKKKSKRSQKYVKKTSKITTSKKRSIRPAIKGKGDGVRAGQAPNIVFQQKIPLFPMMKHRLNRSRPLVFKKLLRSPLPQELSWRHPVVGATVGLHISQILQHQQCAADRILLTNSVLTAPQAPGHRPQV